MESCSGCVERFLDKNEKWRDKLSDLEDTVDAGKKQLSKYLKVMEESGKTPKELERLEDENLKAIVSVRRELVNEMRDRMEKDVEGFFNCPNASDRVGDGEDCDY